MSFYRSINIRMDQRELDLLAALARRELRHPRDQARLILRAALEAEVDTRNAAVETSAAAVAAK